MNALRWKRSPATTAAPASKPNASSSGTTSSSATSAAGCTTSFAPISPAIAADNNGAELAVQVPPKPVRNAKLKLEIDSKSADQLAPIGSPGCFPLRGWTSVKLKSAANRAAAKGAKVDAPCAPSPPVSPVGTGPHCYVGSVSPCSSAKLSPSPMRSARTLRSLVSFRKQILCSHCNAVEGSTENSSETVANEQQPNLGMESSHCWVCCKVNDYEAQLAKAFFRPDQVDGKVVRYPGLPVDCYRKWFKQRPMSPPESVRKTKAKRAEMMNALHRQHKLHYPKLQDICIEIGAAFDAATCFISVADTKLELIVGNHGSMLYFSCFPREIGMCDFAMGSSEQHLLVNNVPKDPIFRENPMLQVVNASFYFGIPIYANGIAIGAIAVMDPQSRTDPPDPAAVHLMKEKAELMGMRVSALLSGAKTPIVSRIMRRQSQ